MIGKGSKNCVVLVGIVAVVASPECIGYSCKRQFLVVCAASAVSARVGSVSLCGYTDRRWSRIFAKDVAEAAGLRYNLSSLTLEYVKECAADLLRVSLCSLEGAALVRVRWGAVEELC